MNLDGDVRASIMDLHANYANALDDGEIDKWGQCFTEDGRLETTRPVIVAGRRNVVEFGHLWLAAQPGQTRHSTWHHLLTSDGDRVLGRCSAMMPQTTPAGVSIGFTAVYRDVFTFEDKAWRIAERHVTMDLADTGVLSSPIRPAKLRAVD